MSYYIDGYVIPLKKDKLEEYKAMAEDAGPIWMRHGAIAYFECVGDDLAPDMGDPGIDNFPKRFQLKEDETVIFSFIIYPSREARDEINAKVMADPDMGEEKYTPETIPFDMKKMLFAGFKSIVALEK